MSLPGTSRHFAAKEKANATRREGQEATSSRPHSMTWSASESRLSEICSPSALAVATAAVRIPPPSPATGRMRHARTDIGRSHSDPDVAAVRQPALECRDQMGCVLL